MFFEVPPVGVMFVFPCIVRQKGTVPADVLQTGSMLTQEFFGIIFFKLFQFEAFGEIDQERMFVFPFPGGVERFQFGETLKVPDTGFSHTAYSRSCRLFVELGIKNLHFPPGVDTVVVYQRCDLDVFVEDLRPADVRVFFFFLDFPPDVGVLFFSVSNSSFVSSNSF